MIEILHGLCMIVFLIISCVAVRFLFVMPLINEVDKLQSEVKQLKDITKHQDDVIKVIVKWSK